MLHATRPNAERKKNLPTTIGTLVQRNTVRASAVTSVFTVLRY
jgi:hypothetical protein